MQVTLKVVVAAIALAVAWHVGQITQLPAKAPGESVPDVPVVRRAVPVGGQFRGMAIQLHGDHRIHLGRRVKIGRPQGKEALAGELILQ